MAYMREFFAGLGAALIGLFGMGGGEPAQPAVYRTDQPAAAIVAQTANTDPAPTAPVSTSTIVNQFITQTVIEREVLPGDAITRAELDTALAGLRSDLLAAIQGSLPSVYTIASPAASAPVSTATFAHSQKIDKLANVTITNATVSGVIGLTNADIPDDITASNYLPLTGGTLTTASSSQFSVFSKAYFGGLATSTFDSLGSLTLAGTLSVSTTTATSTFAGGLEVDGDVYLATTTITGGLTVAGNTNITDGGQLTVGDKIIAPGEIGVGTSTPWGKLAVVNTGTIPSFIVGDEDNDTSPFIINASGNVGIGTASPGAKLDIIQTWSTTPALRMGDVTTDATQKLGRLSLRHYTNSEEDVTLIQGDSDGTNNNVTLGGGTAFGNAATELRFYTAGTINTTTGTERMSVDSSGTVRMTSSAVNLVLRDNSTNSTDKYGRLGIAHYTNSEEPMAVLIGGSEASDSFVSLGGGTSLMNAVKSLRFFTAADTTTTSGTERMRIDSIGNVGIGTTSPASLLALSALNASGYVDLTIENQSPSAAWGSRLVFGGKYSGGWARARIIGDPASNLGGSLTFQTANTSGALTTRLDIGESGDFNFNSGDVYFANSSGNVGIGTTNPGTAALAVMNGYVGIGTTTPAAALNVYKTGVSATGNAQALFGTASAVTQSNGINATLEKVEIGGATSQSGDSGFAGLTLSTKQTGTNNLVGALWFANSGLGVSEQRLAQVSASTDGATNSGGLYFGTTNAGTYGTKMTITGSGNVGIGSTTPYAKLSVKGAGSTTGVNFQTTNSSDSPLFTILDSGNVGIGTTTPRSMFEISKATLDAAKITLAYDSQYHGNISYDGSGAVGFLKLQAFTSPAETSYGDVVLSPLGGNVGIGTTSPWRTLSVTGTVGFDGLTGATGAGSLCLSANREVVYNSGSDSCLSSTRITKHDIAPLTLDALSQVVALQPVSFVYNNDASSTVRYGFIAEDAAAVDSHLATYDAQGVISGIDDRSIISLVVKAIQELRSRVEAYFSRTEQLEARVAALEAQLAASAGGSSNSPSPSGDDESAPDTEAPVITINGNNPATLQIGDTYNDLGAVVTDNVDTNLGYQTFVGETPIEWAHVDTSEPNEWHIYYVATDNAGNTATSTRTVIVESPSIVPDEPADLPAQSGEPEQQQDEEPTPAEDEPAPQEQ